jgi:hypothetical protein
MAHSFNLRGKLSGTKEFPINGLQFGTSDPIGPISGSYCTISLNILARRHDYQRSCGAHAAPYTFDLLAG